MTEEIVNDNPVEAAVETPEVETPEVETPEVETPVVETPAESEPVVEPPEPKTVPVAVVADLRAKNRRLAEENLRLTQSLTPSAPPPIETEEESPLEKFAKEVGEDIPPDAKTLIAQKKWEQTQSQKKNQQATFAKQQSDYTIGVHDATLNMTDEEMGEGLGFGELMTMGNHLLTTGDRLDIFQAGTKSGREAYKRLTQRILQAGGKQAQVLRQRLDSRTKLLKEQKDKGGNPGNPATPVKQKVNKTQEELLTEFSDPHLQSVFGTKPKREEE